MATNTSSDCLVEITAALVESLVGKALILIAWKAGSPSAVADAERVLEMVLSEGLATWA